MAINKLHVTDFRNLASVSIAPAANGINIIEGENASGKTSLLEAIYFLSVGKSFRTHLIPRIIRHDLSYFSLFAEVFAGDGQLHHIGIERHLEGQVRIRLNGTDIKSAAKLAEILPVQLIHPHSFQLLEGGPSQRRNFLDWGVFHVEHKFMASWRQYVRALKQRNVALKQRASPIEIDAWNHELVTWGLPITGWRMEYVERFMEHFTKLLPELLTINGLEVTYYPGWESTETFEMALQRSLMRDQKLNYTQFGPHHADLRFTINGLPAKEVLSRGQQKLFICAMKLAQGQMVRQDGKNCVYLIDDLASELDVTNQRKIIDLLGQQNCQMFLTCTDYGQVSDKISTLNIPVQTFHVKQGAVLHYDTQKEALSTASS